MRLCLPILQVLSHRGVKDPEHFLRQPTWQDLPSAFSIAGVSDGVARLRRAIEERERVVIFGDYDCDGTLAAVILRSTMRRLGHDARIYLPHRDEGYGFSSEAVHRFSRERMHLVITADNGINAEESVRLARRTRRQPAGRRSSPGRESFGGLGCVVPRLFRCWPGLDAFLRIA